MQADSKGRVNMHLFEHEYLLLMDRLAKAEQELYESRADYITLTRRFRHVYEQLDRAEAALAATHMTAKLYWQEAEEKLVSNIGRDWESMGQGI
jgi:hypothetical protein